MIKKKEPRRGKMEIDLTGPDGNAFYLLGIAKKFASTVGVDQNVVIKEMTASDYENLIIVFDNYFGDYIDLLR